MNITPDMAFTIAMGAGWAALVVAFVWPSSSHCRCCIHRLEDERRRDSRRHL